MLNLKLKSETDSNKPVDEKKIKDDKVHWFTKCQIDDLFSFPFTFFLYSQKIWVNGCMTEALVTK